MQITVCLYAGSHLVILKLIELTKVKGRVRSIKEGHRYIREGHRSIREGHRSIREVQLMKLIELNKY